MRPALIKSSQGAYPAQKPIYCSSPHVTVLTHGARTAQQVGIFILGRVVVLSNIQTISVLLCVDLHIVDHPLLPENQTPIELQSLKWSTVHVIIDILSDTLPVI